MTDAELAILSLVDEAPRHGYEIQQAIEARGMRQWTAIGFSSVYYLLNKLERQGLLESRLTHSARGPARKVYQITQAGRGVLQTALVDLLSVPRNQGMSLALGLANIAVLRPEQARNALDTYEASLQARIADVAERRARQLAEHPDSPLHILAVFDHALTLAQAELNWLRAFRTAWEGRVPPVTVQDAPPPAADSAPTKHPPARTERLPRQDQK